MRQNRHTIIGRTLGALFVSSFALPVALSAGVFDWEVYNTVGNPEQWSPTHGDLSGSFSGVDGTGVNVGINLETPGGATWNGNEGLPVIARSEILADGALDGGGLQLDLNFQNAWGGSQYVRTDTGGNVEVTVTFSQWVSGVSFTLFDVDHGPDSANPNPVDPTQRSFVDSISQLSANSKGGSVAPTVSAWNGTDFTSNAAQWQGIGAVQDGTSGNVYYYGKQNSINSPGFEPDDPETISWQQGQLHVDFGNNWISGFTFTYSGYTPTFGTMPGTGDYVFQLPWSKQVPSNQGIAIGQIHFTPVPEAGTVVGIGLFLLGAGGFEYRRRKRLAVEATG